MQHECIPQALLGMDIICQAKSGMGKTAVFVLATLHQLVPAASPSVLVLCHTRELAFQIGHEYHRFSKYMPEVKTAVLYGGALRRSPRPPPLFRGGARDRGGAAGAAAAAAAPVPVAA